MARSIVLVAPRFTGVSVRKSGSHGHSPWNNDHVRPGVPSGAFVTGGTNDFCGVRITVDGNELNPAVGTDFAFDSTDDGDEGTSSWESHAIARSSETLAAGNHPVQVQFRATTGATLRLDDWALVIHRTKLS